MLAVNMGTGTVQDAANLVEYCSAPVGTQYADLRAAHGVDAQFVIVPGLADPDAISIICINLTGYYLQHVGNTISFAVNDLMAIGVISALHDAGLAVPDDIAVMGFDNERQRTRQTSAGTAAR